MSRSASILLLALLIPLPGWTADEASQASESAPLTRLIAQLGSPRYHEREKAMTALLRHDSTMVVPLLQKTLQSNDLEVRCRAKQLLDHHERRLFSKRVLEPQLIRLNYKDTPITEAIADFSRRTGYLLKVDERERAEMEKRKITLETGEISFWNAYQQLCAKAGLGEHHSTSTTAAQPAHSLQNHQQRIIWLDQQHMPPKKAPEPLVLSETRELPPPMYLAGALRLRVLPGGKSAEKTKEGKIVSIPLEIELEPRFEWKRVVALRIEKALDLQGQVLQQPSVYVGVERVFVSEQKEIIILWDGMTEFPEGASRQATVQLRCAEKSSRQLKELRGTLAVEIGTPPQPLVTVDEVFKADKSRFEGLDDSYVVVQECTRLLDGQFKLVVETRLPPRRSTLPTGPGIRVFPINRAGRVGGTTTLSAKDAKEKGLALYDAKGKPLLLATGEYTKNIDPNIPQTYTLYYQPARDQGDPVRFVLSGRRSVTVEVPFTLQNVPLP